MAKKASKSGDSPQGRRAQKKGGVVPIMPSPSIVQQPAAQLVELPAGYPELLSDLKERVRVARLRAAVAVNRELVLLYWGIGRQILEWQQREGWGAKVIDRLAQDLHVAFPEMKGFSSRNLKYMRAFGGTYADEEFVQQAAAQLTEPPIRSYCRV